MVKNKTSLVLEGGGMRGAYTAGALCWLIDNNIEFDNAYGISTGAVHLCNYLMKNKKHLHDLSVYYIKDEKVVGVKPLLRCGRIVDYDYLFDYLLKSVNFSIEPLKNEKRIAKIGLYELNIGETVYVDVQNMSEDELKAACTLPILGKTIKIGDREILDGGISEMIPIKESIKDGCTRHLVISTKPSDYVRKPAKKSAVLLMKLIYSSCPNIARDYEIRHLNFKDQIDCIKDLVNKNEAVYICPSKHSSVTRLGGTHEELEELFELGRSDMEAHKEEILKLINSNV